MQIQNLFQPFEIELYKVDRCPCKPHKHTFFELVYMFDGDGVYHINENSFNYMADNLFLIMPNDSHHTSVASTTTFLFIRFNNIYLNAQKSEQSYSDLGEWIHKLEYILQNSNHLQGMIIHNEKDRSLVRAVCEGIAQEYNDKQALQKELLQQLINTLITIVCRNISSHIAEKANAGFPVSFDMTYYIHQNIYKPEKLRAETLAAHFNISVNYISEYFKKHTNETLQQYIMNYKLSLIEIRLRHSNMRLSEIAYEFGFTDESHLTKTFKKYRGMSPAKYRKGLSQAKGVHIT